MTTLLRDLIDIPERAGAEDYVLRLTDSVAPGHVESTLAAYVVTPDLADSFDAALGLIADAVTTGISRGAFLSGSFGSGKSHFMAVLHAIVRHDPAARAKLELQPVIARHDATLQDRRFLPLAFHMLGAESMEEALFAGYIRQIHERHPRAPLPALHQSDELFRDAEGMRAELGDARFFERLNGGGAQDAWAALLGSGTWNAETYAQARAASPAAPQRQELVSVLVSTFFGAYVRQAGYVDLDTGLAAISAHAQALGYTAVVLFLDELVLWLAFSVQDREFFRRESQKLTKLVEAGVGNRPIPLVSFVARQMDLRQWFADAGASGAEQDALDRAFRHQDNRFATIKLGDDNLPYVAQQRLLQPKDERARQELADRFASLDRRPDVWDVLLDGVNTDEQHRGSGEAAFRQTYPFSPVLVSTLRSLASVMQRERTALKVMQQMLVDRRDELTADDVIPVGDAFSYIVQGQSGQALDQASAALFRAASTLYEEKLHPVLLRKYSLTEDDLVAGTAKPPGLVGDERLAQTLLLSAVAPKVPALKALTAARLAALNHGSILTPLPGNEATTVVSKVNEWARYVPEIHVDTDARNPVIRMQLSDVDYESIVEKAKAEDNEGRRRELIKSLVSEALGVELGQQDMRGAYTQSVVWRGSRREIDLVFGNVRDRGWLPDEIFQARPGTWRFVIDHPFDEAGHSSAEDVDRLQHLIASPAPPERTVVWLPRFFTEERMRDVRRLVILNWLIDGSEERWTAHADHLSEHDRLQARAILESSRTTLRQSVERAIQVAYEAATPTGGQDVVTDAAHEWVLTSLDRGFDPQRPVGASLGAAFASLWQQAFDSSFPGHPAFEPGDGEVRPRDLKAVYEHVERAMADDEHRVPLTGDIKQVRRVANALGVGKAGEQYFNFGDDYFDGWGAQIERELGRRGDDEAPVSVSELRTWIRAVSPPKGLKEEVSDLVVLGWAALRGRAWFSYGAPIPTPAPGALRPEMEARIQPMPAPAEWSGAVTRAAALLGVHASPYATPQEVAGLAARIGEAVRGHLDDAARLVRLLEQAYARLGQPTNTADGRLATARAAAQLTAQLRQLDGVALVRRLGADDPARDQPIARSLTTAAAVTAALEAFHWERLQPLEESEAGEGERAEAAAQILQRLRHRLTEDEFVSSVRDGLRRADDELFEWLRGGPPPPAPPPPPTPPPSPHRVGRQFLQAGEPADALLAELDAFRRRNPGQVVVEWRTTE